MNRPLLIVLSGLAAVGAGVIAKASTAYFEVLPKDLPETPEGAFNYTCFTCYDDFYLVHLISTNQVLCPYCSSNIIGISAAHLDDYWERR